MHRQRKLRNHALTLALAGLLAACGGGGGGEAAPVASTETFQLRTAYVNHVNDTQTRSAQLSGRINGVDVTGRATLSAGALTNTTFEGLPALAKTSTVAGTLTVNGAAVPITVTTTTYVDAAYNPLGEADGDEYQVVSGTVAIPATGKVGDSGVWYTAERYVDSGKSSRLGTLTVSYALEADTATTALLRIVGTDRDTGGNTTTTTTARYRLTPAGALTPISEVSSDSTGTLTATY